MAKGSLNVTPLIKRWWVTDGLRRPIWYLVVPVTVGSGLVFFERQADHLEALLTGIIFLSGILLNIMFAVYRWADEAASALDEIEVRHVGSSWERERHIRRLRAIGRLYDTLTWAMLMSLALIVALIILNTESAAGQTSRSLVTTTAVVGGLGTHFLIVMLTIVNRLLTITSHTVRRHQTEAANS